MIALVSRVPRLDDKMRRGLSRETPQLKRGCADLRARVAVGLRSAADHSLQAADFKQSAADSWRDAADYLQSAAGSWLSAAGL